MPEKRSDRQSWLVMLYLAGDNSLSEDMVLALQALQAEGPPEDDRIVAQLDPSGVGLLTRRYDFSEAGSNSRKKRLEDYRVAAGPETNTGSPLTLTDFVRWARGRYGKGRHHLLILSGHGSGTTEDFLMKDETSMDSLTIDELEKVLEEMREDAGRKLDVLGMDACYMAMGEVAYEVRKHVELLIGAEGLEPAFGWPYAKILRRAKAWRASNDRALSPPELAAAVVDVYVDHYSDYDHSAGRSADMAAIRLPQIEEVRRRFGRLVRALQRAGKGEHDALVLAHWYAQTYKADQFVDLKDLCEQIKKRSSSAAVRARCDGVIEALELCVLRAGCSGFATQHSYGLSIYFPWGAVSPDYDNLAFARVTGWHAFLQDHVRATRRESRYGQDEGSRLRALLPGRIPLAEVKRSRRRELRRWLAEAKLLTRAAAGSRPEGLAQTREQAVVRQMAALKRVKTAGLHAVDRLDKAVERVAQTDISDVDVGAELTRRVLRGGAASARASRHSERTRHGERTRHSERTRAFEDREAWVKNLPPVVGTAFWPRRKRAAKP